MVFKKTCPLCKENFLSLGVYMTHIKNNHDKISPEAFVQNSDELKWSFRNSD